MAVRNNGANVEMTEDKSVPRLLDRVSIRDLADELGCLAQSIHKIVDRKRFEKQQLRDQDRRNQLVITISADDAEFVRTYWRETNRRSAAVETDDDSSSIAFGVFYLMQLEPVLQPGRIKVGFTFDVDERLRKHRCVAPHIAIVKTWPCRKRWEFTAIDSITRNLEQIHTEVFLTTCIDDIVARADRFFQLMPGAEGRL